MTKKLIDSAVIVSALTSGTKAGVLDEVVAALVASKRLAKKEEAGVRKQLAERESLGSTGIGNGVAVPHVKSAPVKEVCLALARSVEGIVYEAIDGKPVHTIFLILAPEGAGDEHLRALRWISTLARSADFRRFVMSAKTEQDIRDLLREMSQSA